MTTDTETEPPATSHMGGHFDPAYQEPGRGAFGFTQWTDP